MTTHDQLRVFRARDVEQYQVLLPSSLMEYYEACPPLRPASLAFSLPGSKLPEEAFPPLEAISR